jgi:hypothetical protein
MVMAWHDELEEKEEFQIHFEYRMHEFNVRYLLSRISS